MRVVSKSAGYLSMIERYDLCDIFAEPEASRGLIICYALSTCKSARLESLDVRAVHEEIGVVEKWHRKYTAESFADAFNAVGSFLGAYDNDDFGRWTVTIMYLDIDVILSGNRENTEIGVSYPKDRKLNLLPLLSDIEAATYDYNHYDRKIMDILKNEFQATEKRAVLTIQKLQKHTDIYREFATAATTRAYADKRNAITVAGFTAEALSTGYPLSLLGAYNYLIYLRESPEEALEDLKKGLIKK